MSTPASLSPLLLIDIGNTRLKWAWCDAGARPGDALARDMGTDTVTDMGNDTGADVGTDTALPTPWRHAGAVAHDDADALAAQWQPLLPLSRSVGAVPAVWISNVAGPVIATRVDAALAAVFGVLPEIHWVRTPAADGELTNGYREPTQLGVDRWTGSVGARRYRRAGHLLIVTAGTATTLDIVLAQPEGGARFAGGLILPGLDLMMRALARNTAQLPAVDADEAAAASPWADNTHDAIAAGCVAAQLGAIERAWRALAARGQAHCLLSGGARHVLARALPMPFEMHDNLVLLGLHVMATRRFAATA
jgi:type III pantothenate kinase